MQISPDEVLATAQDMFPHQIEIAALTAVNRRQASQITDLEDQLASIRSVVSDHTGTTNGHGPLTPTPRHH